MKLCHLYDTVSTSEKIKEILEFFTDSASVDISEAAVEQDYNIYIVELAKVNKDISTKLRKILQTKSHKPLIYFYISKEYNLMLFQLAFLLNVKTVITPSQDTSIVISKIKKDFINHKHEYIENLLGRNLIVSEYFILYKDEKIYYASKKIFEDFRCESLAQVEEKVCSQIDIKELLLRDSIMKNSISSELKSHISFHIRSNTLDMKDEKLISFEPFINNKSSSDKYNFISSRINFIELLKDKLIETSISHKSVSIITIKIENMQRLSDDLSEIELETLFKNLLLEVDATLDNKIKLAQYDGNLYLALFEDIEFEDLKVKAQDFHNKISRFIEQQKFSPRIGLFAFDINHLNLNDVLTTLQNILNKTLSEDDVNNKKLQYITNIQDNMDDDEIIQILFESAFTNALEFKLLNIYKGLCINTSSKIVKIKDELIYVKIEHLQGIAMQNEKETVLQSSNFIKDIRASVKYVNLEKNIAILENFEFLNTNANAREYSRVTCSTRTPIVVSHLNSTLNGEVIDISVTSVAIKVKHSKLLEHIKDKEVELSFILPTSSNIDGSIKLNLFAKVVFYSCTDDICKLVCDLDEDSSSESILMEYVYNRQKEIIIEVKRMARWV